MKIKLECGNCGKALEAKPNLAGGKANCPSCKHIVAIPNLSIPASHQSAKVELPDVKCIYPGRDVGKTHSLPSEIDEWLSNGKSNLLVLFGEFGTGKSTSLKQALANDKTGRLRSFAFDDLLAKNEGNLDISGLDQAGYDIAVLDNFDAVNSLSGFQVVPPDLRLLETFFANGKRVLVATRRTLATGGELLSQISDESRCETLGIANPTLLQIVPWQITDLQNHANDTGNSDLQKVLAFLSQQSLERQLLFSRPLMIKMLSRISSTLGDSQPTTLSAVYKRFCDLALFSDYDTKRSHIPRDTKGKILRDVAWDIFTSGSVRSGYALPFSRVEQRVLEYVMQDNINTQKWSRDNYQWTQDFVTTNHILETSSVPVSLRANELVPEVMRKRCEFIHQSFYEYYLALALIDKILANEPIGIEVSRLSEATFDSLTLVFIKELVTATVLAAEIKQMLVSRPSLCAADRLILLYLIEDDSEFADILQASPDEYFSQLQEVDPERYGIFISKVARFQLVIVGRYSAGEYLKDVNQYEDEACVIAELHLHGTEQSTTHQLIDRLKNKALAAARQIFVFRLGQLGDTSAIPILEGLSLIDDKAISQESKRSIERIKQRYMN